ncbi:hypothetical protein FACS1894216_17500 [Synergistales bacterium]|nr:hypothetical protein FACS1894216_17500 [Synergistales bacterium]
MSIDIVSDDNGGAFGFTDGSDVNVAFSLSADLTGSSKDLIGSQKKLARGHNIISIDVLDADNATEIISFDIVLLSDMKDLVKFNLVSNDTFAIAITGTSSYAVTVSPDWAGGKSSDIKTKLVATEDAQSADIVDVSGDAVLEAGKSFTYDIKVKAEDGSTSDWLHLTVTVESEDPDDGKSPATEVASFDLTLNGNKWTDYTVTDGVAGTSNGEIVINGASDPQDSTKIVFTVKTGFSGTANVTAAVEEPYEVTFTNAGWPIGISNVYSITFNPGGDSTAATEVDVLGTANKAAVEAALANLANSTLSVGQFDIAADGSLYLKGSVISSTLETWLQGTGNSFTGGYALPTFAFSGVTPGIATWYYYEVDGQDFRDKVGKLNGANITKVFWKITGESGTSAVREADLIVRVIPASDLSSSSTEADINTYLTNGRGYTALTLGSLNENDGNYLIAVKITDNDNFDIDKRSGSILDPIVLGSYGTSDGRHQVSSGGCDAGFGALGLIILAGSAMVLRRKK